MAMETMKLSLSTPLLSVMKMASLQTRTTHTKTVTRVQNKVIYQAPPPGADSMEITVAYPPIPPGRPTFCLFKWHFWKENLY